MEIHKDASRIPVVRSSTPHLNNPQSDDEAALLPATPVPQFFGFWQLVRRSPLATAQLLCIYIAVQLCPGLKDVFQDQTLIIRKGKDQSWRKDQNPLKSLFASESASAFYSLASLRSSRCKDLERRTAASSINTATKGKDVVSHRNKKRSIYPRLSVATEHANVPVVPTLGAKKQQDSNKSGQEVPTMQ